MVEEWQGRWSEDAEWRVEPQIPERELRAVQLVRPKRKASRSTDRAEAKADAVIAFQQELVRHLVQVENQKAALLAEQRRIEAQRESAHALLASIIAEARQKTESAAASERAEFTERLFEAFFDSDD